jgi:hypothetical protein
MQVNRSSKIAQTGLPIGAGGVHRDLADTMRLKPISERQQTRDGRPERLDVLFALPGAIRDAHARSHAGFVHAESGDAFDNDLHQDLHNSGWTGAARREPRLLVDTEERARGTIRGLREGSHASLCAGSQATRS